MIKPPPNILDLPLLDRAAMAMKAAVEKVVEEHAREGLPVYIWRDGKVVAVPVEELRNGSSLQE
jgi:demethoxyubiquinone hydroxylase (CLK1/Coq7/Cat5 family)